MGFYLVRMDAGAIISVWVPRTRLFGGRVGLEKFSSGHLDFEAAHSVGRYVGREQRRSI